VRALFGDPCTWPRDAHRSERRAFVVGTNGGSDRGEAEFGVTAVAAAIRADDEGPALGTVSIAGPGARITEKRAHELAPLVLRTARELSNLWPLRIGGHGGQRQHDGQPRAARRTAVA